MVLSTLIVTAPTFAGTIKNVPQEITCHSYAYGLIACTGDMIKKGFDIMREGRDLLKKPEKFKLVLGWSEKNYINFPPTPAYAYEPERHDLDVSVDYTVQPGNNTKIFVDTDSPGWVKGKDVPYICKGTAAQCPYVDNR